jgi:hypothetical protein
VHVGSLLSRRVECCASIIIPACMHACVCYIGARIHKYAACSRMLLYVGRCCQQQNGAKKRTSQSEGCNQDRRAIVFHAFAIKACVARRSMIYVERYAPNTNNGKRMPGEMKALYIIQTSESKNTGLYVTKLRAAFKAAVRAIN